MAQTAAAENKSAGNLAVLGDSHEFSSGSLGLAGGLYALDGAFAGVAYGTSAAGALGLESGFYSRMVSSPAAPGYSGTSTGSYALAWGGASPSGTLYELQVSTWGEADPYMAYYSTDQNGYPVESLGANTSFYNFIFSNYMEGDYSAIAATTAVTLAVTPSSGPFTLEDAGHSTISLSFAGFENPAAVSGKPWATDSLALDAARYGQASVVYGSHVFLAGGFNGITFSSVVYRGALGPGGTLAGWETASYLPAARYGHQLLAAKGRLYSLGGYDSAGSHAEVWSADISSAGVIGAWLPEAPLPAALYFHAAAVAAGKIYVSGGYASGSGVQGTIYRSQVGDDGVLGGWTAPDALPAPRYSHTMTLIAGRLYVAGGKDGAAARSEVWATQLDAQGELPVSWTEYTPLPAPRFGHKALAAANSLYVIGGSNGSAAQAQVFLSTVSAALSAQAPWQAYNPLPSARQFPAAEIVGEKLWVFGGSSGSAARGEIFTSDIFGTQYLVEVSSNAGFGSAVRSSGWMSSPAWREALLEPGLQYYFRAKARNWTGTETGYSAAGSTTTYAALPATAPWSGVGAAAGTVNWLANGNPAGYTYEVVYSKFPDFSSPTSLQTTDSFYTLGGLLPTTTYYAKVRVLNIFGRNTRYVELPPQRTSFDPALDVSSPTYTDNQADFNDWKGTNTFTCDVDFADLGGSGIQKFQVQVATDAGGASGIVAAWSDAVTGIDQDAYAADWTIPQGTWEQLPEGASSYISVKVFDNSGNYAAYTDLFSLIKDTTPPEIAVTYSTPAVWYTEYPGDVDGLRFGDGLSGLAKVQYSVSANKLFADAAIIPWTDIGALTPGATWYRPVITYSFPQLANAASNYFSFRAVDVAGTTRTVVDAFGIGKNVSGPVVTISTPALTFLSTFTWLSGNAYPTNDHAIRGTEVSLRDLSNGLYYNGAAFLSGSRAWQDASDTASTFTITLPGLPLVSGRQYQAVARSSDAVGDYSQVFATYTFTFDSQPPSALVLYPADGATAYSAASISGTAADPVSGITAVDVTLKRLSDGKWWKNSLSSWDTVPEPLQAGTTPYWTWNFNSYLRDSLASGASYYATVRAADASGPRNYGEFHVSGSTFTYVDDTPPPATLTLAAAPGGVSGAVALFWRTAGDNGVSGYLLAGRYKIAYSTFTGAAVSTTSAQVTITTATLTAGSTQAATVTGLSASASYYFTLWTADDALNWSPASNEASATSGAPDTGSLSGRVTDASGNPVTGVLVEALGASGAVEGSDYTDVYGNYSIPSLNSLYLTIRAVWAAQDIESSVSKEQVPNGSAGVNFSLSVTYQLASITGFIPANFLPRQAARPAGFYTTREVNIKTSGAFVEIYRKGRRIGAAFTGQDGSFAVPNLLPGTYSLRVYNGAEYSRMQTVTLRPGENLVFTPKWELLTKAGVYAYPNPARTTVNFHFTSGASEGEVEIFDLTGRLVKKLTGVSSDADKVPGFNSKKISWDLSRENVASGVYLYILRVKDAASGESEKVVKKFAVIR
ncbi:MAG: hypothetical protein A2X35_11425 [Elusimicrobia bacterium GWA2_61_42]|nr:MAG: hypothetical protein A2X35_11425 [Elusimicrobia bacterium GWA2_61_42]OGR75851.1 MAG: hypothetical protein A2X38_07490 [Elusimicrobia bacterium GWC2_61_25]